VEILRIDSQGRFYLPKNIRKAAGIEGSTVLEVIASEGEIVLRARKESVAKGSRGIFKVKNHIGDLDKEIKEKSLQESLGELDEIRRR